MTTPAIIGKMNTPIWKWIGPPLILALPFGIGFLLFITVSKTFGFFLAALFPQVMLWPFASYYSNDGIRVFADHWALASVVFWLLLSLAYGIVVRKLKPSLALIVFIGLWFVFVAAIHALLIMCGFRFVWDSL